jgi:hypothetical protein
MRVRVARLLVFGVGPALAPFLLLVFFTWVRDGQPVGLVPMLGRGDLLPATALLAGGVLVDAYVTRRAGAIWHIAVGISWLAFVLCSVGYVVPYASPTVGAPDRLTDASLALLTATVAAGVMVIWKDSP